MRDSFLVFGSPKIEQAEIDSVVESMKGKDGNLRDFTTRSQ
jgi:hypothetical protein